MSVSASAPFEALRQKGVPTWLDMDGPRTAFTHGPERLIMGPEGTMTLGPVFPSTELASEDARKVAALHKTNRVVYKLVPVSLYRARSGRVE
jgi:hypothetical protein